jgi:hypothetical protein
MNRITVLFPGGFKPLTGAHLDLANRYAQNSEVERVILLTGPKERDGITREKTIELFNILNDNSKIVIQPTEFNSPIMAAYEYLFALPPDATGRYAMAASAKGDDYVRAKDFVPNVDKYATIGDKKGRMIPKGIDAIELSVNVDPLMYPNQQPVSATMVRQSLATDDYETFRMSYPQYSEAKVKNAWQILKNMAESAFTQEWWTNELQEDVDDVIESMMFPAEKKRHSDKIKKLRSFLDANNDQSFVYDFDKFNKTVFGAKLQENVETRSTITEGGAAGHMAHPWDDHGLTFNDVREIVSRALEGRLDIEQAVTEKTDGQNIQVTWKNGEPGFARNKGTIINPMTTPEFIAEFEAKHQKTIAAYGAAAGEGYQLVVDAFRTCAEDLTAALNKVPAERLNQIFKNGRVFANMEIIYPATRNVIAYEKAHLQFHNLVEYDDSGNTVETDLTGGALMQSVISDANAHMQKTFSFIPPQKIKLGRVYDFEDQQAAFFNEIDQLEQKFNLKDTDLLSDYHKEWWRDVISTQASRLNYNIPESILTALIYRWAFEDKSTNIGALKKQIDSPEFAQWVTEFDKTDFKKYRKQNLEPFESIFLRLGVLVLQNATNFLAANPSKVVQQIKTELADLIKDLQKTNNQATLDKLKLELKRIERLGGFESIVPAEGVVFTYRGNTYKLTGAFAPINQILGVLKYAR